jgi:undecaprenyl-diphosphatase
LLGSAGVTVLHAVAFVACVHAVGGHASWLDVTCVYVVGAAAAAAVPSPGGLGALEAALVLGLTSAGVSTPVAVAAVLWFRLLSYWLPTVPGLAAFGLLLRSQQL